VTNAGRFAHTIAPNGDLTCAADADTQYSGANFALSSQTCSVGQMVTGIDASGKVTCVSTSSGGGILPGFCSTQAGAITFSAGMDRRADPTYGLPIPGDGTFTSLAVNPFTNTFDGDTVVTVVVNGADTALAITIPAGSTAIQIDTSDVPVLAGDFVALKLDGRLSDPILEPKPFLDCIAS